MGILIYKKMKKHNGYRSWNEWNVSLWINNDEALYRHALDLVNNFTLAQATKIFMRHHWTTPDKAYYNRICVYNTLKELKNG
jgi:hypothetical protein